MHVMCLQAEALVEDGVLLPYNTRLLLCQLMRIRQQVELWRGDNYFLIWPLRYNERVSFFCTHEG